MEPNLERVFTAKPGTLRYGIEGAMWEEFEKNNKTAMHLDDIINRMLKMKTFPSSASARNQVSAQLSHMKNEGIILHAGTDEVQARHSSGTAMVNRRMTLYTLEAIAEIATKPNDGFSETIDVPSGPPAKHVNRPPLNVPSKEEFERKTASQGNTVPAEKTATGLPIASVPAHEFAYYDGNTGGGKLTTERRPEKPQDSEAIQEMVNHIRRTEGSIAMAAGAPKHGTDEAVFAEYDKRINRLADLLEKAVENIAKANREGIAKQEITNEENRKSLNLISDAMESIQDRADKQANESIEIFRGMVDKLLKLWIDSTNGQRIVTAMMDNVMQAMKETIQSNTNVQLIRAKAYTQGWEDAKKEGPNVKPADIPVTQTLNETAIQAEEMAKEFGIGLVVIDNIAGDIPPQPKIAKFDLFGKE